MTLSEFLDAVMDHPEGYVYKQYHRYGVTVILRGCGDGDEQLLGHWLPGSPIPEEYLHGEVTGDIAFSTADKSIVVVIGGG